MPEYTGGHRKRVTSIAFSPDGAYVASASRDGTVKLWDAHARPPRQVLNRHTDAVTIGGVLAGWHTGWLASLTRASTFGIPNLRIYFGRGHWGLAWRDLGGVFTRRSGTGPLDILALSRGFPTADWKYLTPAT